MRTPGAMRQTGRKLIIGLILACIVYLLTPAAFAEQEEVIVTVEQVLTQSRSAAPPNHTFDYQLIPEKKTNPMPDGTNEHVYAFSITGTAKKHIGPIRFSEPGNYNYKIIHTTTKAPNYIYDQKEYDLEIVVKNDGINIIAHKNGGLKAMSIGYTHTYEEFPDYPPIIPDPPDPPNPTDPPNPHVSNNPPDPHRSNLVRTGDTFKPLLWILLLIFTTAGATRLLTLHLKTKKRP